MMSIYRLIFLMFIISTTLHPVDLSKNNNYNFPKEQRPQLPHYYDSQKELNVKLPPIPKEQGIYNQAGDKFFTLKSIVLEGNTVFSDDELKQISKDFLNRKVSLSDLEEIRYRITRYYTDKGYINSGAIIKHYQNIKYGVIVFEIKEGKLSEINISGNEGLNTSYISHRIWPDKEKIFNTNDLQENFQILLNDPLITKMDGKLLPSTDKGVAKLDLNIFRSEPYALNIIIDNSGSPSSGSERLKVNLTVRNTTGFGDSISIDTGVSKGYKNFNGIFLLPLDIIETYLELEYSLAKSSIIEKPLDQLNIKSDYNSFKFNLNHPIFRNLFGHFIIGESFSVIENTNTLLGDGFPLSLGEDDNGRSKVTILSFWQDYQLREKDWVFAALSTFNVGLDAFNSTINDSSTPDSKYLNWIGQIQYAKKIFKSSQFIARANMQLSNDQLLPTVQYSIGGYDTIRGYRENTLVRDNGFMLSGELHYPILKHKEYGELKIIPFIDYGNAWDYHNSKHKYLLGSGLGFILSKNKKYSAELFFAHDIEQAPEYMDENLQDNGIYFRFEYHILG